MSDSITDADRSPPGEVPPSWAVRLAEEAAARSPCEKSRRGVVAFTSDRRISWGTGWNGPPGGAPCPGRSICGDACRRLCVHAEVRAIRAAIGTRTAEIWDKVVMLGRRPSALSCDLLHVKIGDDGLVVAGGPPSCEQCAREILDVGFVDGVWLYEHVPRCVDPRGGARWRRYEAGEFHRVTLRNAGLSDLVVLSNQPA